MEGWESEYPTDEQIEEMFMAWEKDGEAGILGILRKRRHEREENEATGKDSAARGWRGDMFGESIPITLRNCSTSAENKRR
jgi:hypothetical protein